MAHLKRYSMPPFWGLGVKETAFVARPKGSHPQRLSIPLRIALRDILRVAGTSREVDRVLLQGKILVDKKPRSDSAFGLGLMDILEIPDAEKAYRIDMETKGLVIREAADRNSKLCKIRGKSTARGGKTQFSLHDGSNLLVEKAPYSVGDSLLLSLPDRKVLGHFPLKKGAEALITSGRNRGLRGTVTALGEKKFMMEKPTAVLTVSGKNVETLKSYVFVTGGDHAEKGDKKRDASPAEPKARKQRSDT